MNTYETVDYTKPRDICYLKEDIEIFKNWYKQENPDCTLREYLEEEITNIPYYKRKEIPWQDVVDQIERYI